MVMSYIRFAAFTIAFTGIAAPASAQETSRGFISINGGYQASTTEFDDSFTFSAHQETGTTRVTYPIDAGPIFDAGGGVRLWKGLGVGLAVSRFTIDSTVQASSSIPHPFFPERHREVSGEAGDIRREETGIHVQAQYSIPLGRLHLTLMAGPSVLQVSQAMVIDVNYSEEYPYDTAAFAGVDTTSKKGSKAGFNAGADVRWMFSRSFGVGGVVRFSRATIDLDEIDGRTVSVDAGGVQAGVGIRIGF